MAAAVRCPALEAAPPLLLALLLALLTAPGCRLPVRVVKIPAAELAARAHSAGRLAESRGERRAAAAAYREAIDHDASHPEAWLGLVRTVDPQQREQLGAELRRQLADGAPPMAELGMALLGPPKRRDAALRAAWRHSDGQLPALVDPAVMKPLGVAGWRHHAELALSLQPATPARDLQILLALFELSDIAGLRSALDGLSPSEAGRQLVEALVLFDAGEVEAARKLSDGLDLEELSVREPDVARALARLRALRSIEEQRLGETPRHLAALREVGGDAGDIGVLEAIAALRSGDVAGARRRLQTFLERCTTPRLRVAGALLAARLEVTGGPEALREALRWAPRPRDVETLRRTLIAAGDAAGALTATERLLEEETPAALTAALRAERATLARLCEGPELLPDAWDFLRARPAVERRQALEALAAEILPAVVRFAVEEPDATLRLLALRAVRERSLVPIEALPATLARDDDPRVRAAWILVVAAGGGARARAAILDGRRDADAYVREIADGLPLPDGG